MMINMEEDNMEIGGSPKDPVDKVRKEEALQDLLNSSPEAFTLGMGLRKLSLAEERSPRKGRSKSQSTVMGNVDDKSMKFRTPRNPLRDLLPKSRTIGGSLLSQRIEQRGTLMRNATLLLTPEIGRIRAESESESNGEVEGRWGVRQQKNISSPVITTPKGPGEFGLNSYTRSQIMAGLNEYRQCMTPSTRTASEDEPPDTPQSASKRRCTPKSLFR